MHAAAAAGVFAFGILADDDPVDARAARERTGDAGQHARRTHVGILVEALADRQPQAPQRNVIGHIGRTHRAEEYGIESFEFVETTGGNVVAVLEVVVAAPGEMLDVELEPAVAAPEPVQHFESGGNHFGADAIAGDGGNPIGAHGSQPVSPGIRLRAGRSRHGR